MKRFLMPALLACSLFLSGCAPQEKEPDQWTLRDFEGCFEETYETQRETYKLLEGTEEENTVHVLRGSGEGPVIYVVAGVHGDEVAGWRAGNLLKEATVKAGTVYIVSPANVYGAGENQRKTKSARDLNRSFPGDPDGWDAQRIAWSIYSDIQDKDPVLVMDLHEAIAKEDDYEKLGANYDALGNSLICHSLDGIGDMVLELLLASEAGELCSTPFILYNAPPVGSVNHTVTTELGIPTITLETLRAEPLAQRVQNQLEILQYIFTCTACADIFEKGDLHERRKKQHFIEAGLRREERALPWHFPHRPELSHAAVFQRT